MIKIYRVVAPNGVVLGIYESDGTKFCSFRTYHDWIALESGESLLDGIRRFYKWERAEVNPLELEECAIGFDKYYRRMYRPVFDHEEDTVTLPAQDVLSLISGLGQLAVLVEQLSRLFRVVFPENHNLDVYGHEIRNLIILACTEVEAQWRGVLRMNHYNGTQHHFTTKDYVKLFAPLKLAEYQVSLPLYPQIPSISPFVGWDQQKPTQSLPWYEAYNAVKHDRENKFPQAKLQYAVDAVTACAVMLQAQYGIIPAWRDYLGQFFRFDKKPMWPAREQYLCREKQWQPVDFPF
jgi:hypothetical protein